MSNAKKAAIEYAIERVPESAKFKEQIIVGNHLREEIHDSFIRGYEQCQTEYEEKLRWIPVEEKYAIEFPIHVIAKRCESYKYIFLENEACVNYLKNCFTHWRPIHFL